MTFPTQGMVYILSADAAASDTITKILNTFGHQQIRILESGIEAIQCIQDQPPSMILCDMSIKHISGWALIKEIKNAENIPNIPIILMSKDEPPAKEEELRQYGVVNFLKAPYRKNELSFLINSTLLLFKTSGTVEAKYTQAKKALIDKKYDEAVQQFIELRSLTRNSGRSSIGLAQAYIKEDQLQEASKVLSTIQGKEALSPSAHMMKLKLLLERKQNKEASRYCLEFIQNDVPDLPFYYSKCLTLFIEYKDQETIEAICLKAIEKGFQMPEFLLNLAKTQYYHNKFDAALKTLHEAKTTYGPSCDILNVEGICLKKLLKFKEALIAYEQALELSPMDAKIYFNMASCSIAMKDYEQALKYLESCIGIAPNFTKAQEKIDEIKTYLKKSVSTGDEILSG